MKVTGTKAQLDAVMQALLWWNGCAFGVNKRCIRDEWHELDCEKCYKTNIEWEIKEDEN